MARRTGDWDEFEDDPEAPQESDLTDEDAEQDTRPCPRCRREVWEMAERCPHCGVWMTTRATHPGPTIPTSRQWFYIAGLIAVSLIIAWWLAAHLLALR